MTRVRPGRAPAFLAPVLLLLLAADIVAANPPAASLRPVSREDVFPVALPSFAPARSLRPVLRPRSITQPPHGPAGAPRAQGGSEQLGTLCRDRDLRGQELGQVPAKRNGCGIRQGAIRLYAIGGVRLSRPAVMECATAKALKQWVQTGMDTSVGRYGRGVAEVKVAAGYACRTRNSRPGARISEHGKGRAIDISAFELKNGETISVLNDWGKGRKGRILKDMHRRACGPFGTVLGPDADRHHRDHFHFDIARHRSGPYCR